VSSGLCLRATVYRLRTILSYGWALVLGLVGISCTTDPAGPLGPTQLALATSAAGAPSGAAFTTQPVVSIRDASNYTVTSNSAVVTVTVSAGATVVGTATATASSGLATFTNVGISGTAGASYMLTYASSGLASATQSITLTAGPASQLVLTTTAAGAAGGAAFTTQPAVAIRDAAGNTRSSDNLTVVTMTVSAGATVIGTATATASSGVATFATVGVNGTAGTSYTLTFASPGLSSAAQSITPTVGTASQLVLTRNAAGAASGTAFTSQPVVAIRDPAGNTRTSDNSTAVTMTVNAGGTVAGIATATASSGVATFTNVGISGFGGIYTLNFGAGALTPATQSIDLSGVTFTAVTVANYATCGLMSTGAAYCWGDNLHGQLGDGTTTDRLTPVAVQGGLVFSALGGGEAHTCGLLTNAGAAYCWGNNQAGQLGDGTTTQRLTPVPVQGGLVFTALTSNKNHGCGLTGAGVAYCWGDNRLSPAVVGGLAFTALTAGHSNACGLTSVGAAYCWQFTLSAYTPVAVQGGLAFAALTAGSGYTCGRTSTGAAYCWGDNLHGQLGDGTRTDRSTPVAVQGGLVFAALTANGYHTCGLTSAGAAYCWGENNSGALGDGTTTERLTPVAVQGGLVFTALTAGYYHTCGLTASSTGSAYCWGSNGGGLGDGTATQRLTPVAVLPP
jgi:alpha-tubulin suppressor-like RCC1 family protein